MSPSPRLLFLPDMFPAGSAAGEQGWGVWRRCLGSLAQAGMFRGGSVPQLCAVPAVSQAPAQPRSICQRPSCTAQPFSLRRFIQGSATSNPYVFYHWRYIDIFVYFSHHTVTIPPVVWTNAAHRNSVPVLGKGTAEPGAAPAERGGFTRTCG